MLCYIRRMKNVALTFLLTGSNLGDRAQNLRRAAAEIEREIGKVRLASAFYETEPWGMADQNWFFNQALAVETSGLSPREVLTKIKAIEADLGREQNIRNGPRLIDIDLLFMGETTVDEPDLKVPHPEIQNRNFALVPLMEIAPELRHPALGQFIDELYMASADPLEVILSDEKP